VGKKTKRQATTHTLSEKEYDYLKILNLALSTSIYRDKVISGYLYHLCYLKWNYPENVNMLFEIDLEKDDRQLKVEEIPTEAIQKEMGK
jgi:hypothetical protein